MAHQIASVTPQAKCCILLDTPEYFNYEPYLCKNRFRAYAGAIKSILIERDYGLPWYLIKEKVRNFNKANNQNTAESPSSNTTASLNDGINYFIKHLQTQIVITNCLFVKTTRTFGLNFDHGYNWKKHFRGKFEILPIKGLHDEILKKRNAREIGDFINERI